MKQITRTQAVRDIAKMLGAEKLAPGQPGGTSREFFGQAITPDKPCYAQYGTLYRFYIPKKVMPKEDVVAKIFEYFKGNKFKDGYACKVNGKFKLYFTAIDIDLIKNL